MERREGWKIRKGGGKDGRWGKVVMGQGRNFTHWFEVYHNIVLLHDLLYVWRVGQVGVVLGW